MIHEKVKISAKMGGVIYVTLKVIFSTAPIEKKIFSLIFIKIIKVTLQGVPCSTLL